KGVNSASGHGKLRAGLVISQVALSIVLLVGAGLMMRSLFALQHVDLGLTPDHILVARTPLLRAATTPPSRSASSSATCCAESAPCPASLRRLRRARFLPTAAFAAK